MKSPPKIEPGIKPNTDLDEWDTDNPALDDDDVYCLENLEEFQSTVFPSTAPPFDIHVSLSKTSYPREESSIPGLSMPTPAQRKFGSSITEQGSSSNPGRHNPSHPLYDQLLSREESAVSSLYGTSENEQAFPERDLIMRDASNHPLSSVDESSIADFSIPFYPPSVIHAEESSTSNLYSTGQLQQHDISVSFFGEASSIPGLDIPLHLQPVHPHSSNNISIHVSIQQQPPVGPSTSLIRDASIPGLGIPSQPPAWPKRSLPEDSSEGCPPLKRRKTVVGSLARIIPAPHYYTPPPLVPFPATGFPTTFFRNSKPLAVSPHTLDAIQPLYSDPLTRCAWVIPVRGSFPWHGCSSASFLEDDDLGRCTTLPGRIDQEDKILWTSDAIKSFWTFLIEVRKAKTCGALGLSFHTAPSTSSLQPSTMDRNNIDSSIHHDERGPYDESQSSVETGWIRGGRLVDVDHIKIYVDGCYVVKVRNVVHAWSYQFKAKDGESQIMQTGQDDKVVVGNETKIRLLRGSRIVLIDERSRAIMTC
ncbi:hypothetical protein C8Q75DRAFT_775856 [Abortiporus biennis]|nr:hypothetical protein C8Q75DRAFT_775856 [Abortiporus biennis]